MKKVLIRIFVWILILSTAGNSLFQNRARVLGFLLEAPSEHFLTRLFSMRVEIDGLSWDLLTGDLSCRRFAIMNQKEFTHRPHIEVRDLRGWMNLRELKNHHVWIPLLTVGQLNYLMERVELPDGDRRTNSRMMVWDTKRYVREHAAKHPHKSSDSSKGWIVEINRLAIERGSFLYEQLIPKERFRLSFHDIHGYLDGFRYPTDSKVLSHHGHLEGLFDDERPRYVLVEGPGNYASTDIGFDLKGQIAEGSVLGYEYLWRDLPLEVLDGRFTLQVAARYREDYLDSQSLLTLKALKLKAGPRASEKLSAATLMTLLRFMENEKTIALQIPVHGDITDPTFEVSHAFREAFQQAIREFGAKGIEKLKEGTTKIATGTTQIATKTTETLLHGVGTVTGAVVTKTPVVSEILPVSKIEALASKEKSHDPKS